MGDKEITQPTLREEWDAIETAGADLDAKKWALAKRLLDGWCGDDRGTTKPLGEGKTQVVLAGECNRSVSLVSEWIRTAALYYDSDPRPAFDVARAMVVEATDDVEQAKMARRLTKDRSYAKKALREQPEAVAPEVAKALEAPGVVEKVIAALPAEARAEIVLKVVEGAMPGEREVLKHEVKRADAKAKSRERLASLPPDAELTESIVGRQVDQLDGTDEHDDEVREKYEEIRAINDEKRAKERADPAAQKEREEREATDRQRQANSFGGILHPIADTLNKVGLELRDAVRKSQEFPLPQGFTDDWCGSQLERIATLRMALDQLTVYCGGEVDVQVNDDDLAAWLADESRAA